VILQWQFIESAFCCVLINPTSCVMEARLGDKFQIGSDSKNDEISNSAKLVT